MVSRGLHVLLALVISPPLAACVLQQSLADRLREDQVPRDALVALSEDRAVAAAITGTQVRVFHFWNQAEGWQAQQIASSNFDSGGTVQLLSLAGETGDNWNTFVFGTASYRQILWMAVIQAAYPSATASSFGSSLRSGS